MSLMTNLSHLKDLVEWRSFCDWEDFGHLALVGNVELNPESLKISGVAVIFSNDYVVSEEYPFRWRYGTQLDTRPAYVHTYLFDRAVDQTEFEDDLAKLKVNEVAQTLCGAAMSHKEQEDNVDSDKGLSLRDEITIEDYPKGYLLLGRNAISGEKVVILYHHAFIRPWFFWQHFVEGILTPTTRLD